jgi:hypothetical protein
MLSAAAAGGTGGTDALRVAAGADAFGAVVPRVTGGEAAAFGAAGVVATCAGALLVAGGFAVVVGAASVDVPSPGRVYLSAARSTARPEPSSVTAGAAVTWSAAGFSWRAQMFTPLTATAAVKTEHIARRFHRMFLIGGDCSGE